ncbi:hypothetical protein E2320_013280, partial [Naja naja]
MACPSLPTLWFLSKARLFHLRAHLADLGGGEQEVCRRLRRVLGLRLGLRLETVGRDLVHLPRGGYIHHVVGLDFDFVAGRQEGVETHDQIWVAFEELRDAADHTGKIIVDLRLATKLQLHLVK